MSQAAAMILAMLGARSATEPPTRLPAEVFPRLAVIVLIGALAFSAYRMAVRVRDEKRTLQPASFHLYPALSLALLVATIIHMASTRYMPLIYFKF